MIQTIDNFYQNKVERFTRQNDKKSFLDNNHYYAISFKKDKNDKEKVIELNIKLNDFCDEKHPNNTFFSFFKDKEKRDAKKNEDDLIISIKKSKNDKYEDIYLAQTGNYVGKFVWDGLEIDIKSRFSNIFLERMLNFANDIFLDDVSITGDKLQEDFDISKFIIYYMFVQNLEKAFLLGLPKAYKSIDNHEMKLKGKIDINRFIKHDIPFQGKVSSVSREQKEIPEIIDTLYKAVKVIEKNNFPTRNISHIKTHLKQHRSNKFVSNETINKALKSKALQNPIFAPYKKVLEYARFIINGNNIEEKSEAKNETYGFIINVAELFEIYITKLLQKEFPSWSISSPSLWLAKEFNDSSYMYQRRIIPDITMVENGTNNVMVFDTKYKRMRFSTNQYGSGSDVDRNDFFQINTYMNFYNNQEQYNLIAGGLLYPIEENKEKSTHGHSQSWFGKADTKFIVDGIDLSGKLEAKKDENKFDSISKREEEFITRLKKFVE